LLKHGQLVVYLLRIATPGLGLWYVLQVGVELDHNWNSKEGALCIHYDCNDYILTVFYAHAESVMQLFKHVLRGLLISWNQGAAHRFNEGGL